MGQDNGDTPSDNGQRLCLEMRFHKRRRLLEALLDWPLALAVCLWGTRGNKESSNNGRQTGLHAISLSYLHIKSIPILPVLLVLPVLPVLLLFYSHLLSSIETITISNQHQLWHVECEI